MISVFVAAICTVLSFFILGFSEDNTSIFWYIFLIGLILAIFRSFKYYFSTQRRYPWLIVFASLVIALLTTISLTLCFYVIYAFAITPLISELNLFSLFLFQTPALFVFILLSILASVKLIGYVLGNFNFDAFNYCTRFGLSGHEFTDFIFVAKSQR